MPAPRSTAVGSTLAPGAGATVDAGVLPVTVYRHSMPGRYSRFDPRASFGGAGQSSSG